MNKVFFSGNLTRDPELRYTNTGKAFARTGLAVHRRVKDEVDFFDLVMWDKQAEFAAKYLHKGSRVLVEGRLQTNSYSKDGVERKGFEVIVENVEFGDSKKKDADDDVDVPF